MGVDVIYFVESVPKELDVACIVSRFVRQKFGLKVHIASYKDAAPEWLLRANPRLLVVPTCYAADGWGIKKHIGRWPGVPFLNLAWEELFSRVNATWKYPRDKFAREHVLYHVWGDFYKAALMSHGVPAEHIVVNGHPGYRLYEPPYSEFYPTRQDLARQHGLDAGKRWILFPENYGYAFYGEANMAARVRGGMDPEMSALQQKYCRESLATVLNWCRACADNPDVEMIIRPRPTTQLSHFEAVSRELTGNSLGRIRLIKDGPVIEWLLASDVVVSSFSTSLLEAAIAGKPAYMVEPIPMPEFMWSDWYDDADKLTTADDFLRACLKPQLDSAEDQRLLTWARANLVSRGDPIANLVDLIGSVCAGDIKAPLPPAMAPLVARPQRSLLSGIVQDAWDGVQSMFAGKASPGDQDTRVFGRRDVIRTSREWEPLLRRVTV